MTDETTSEQVTEAPQPKRRGRPPGSKNKPKDIPTPEYVADEIGSATLPQRRRGRRPVEKLTPKQVADMVKMAHALAAANLGPKANISDTEAEALGEAIVPVLEDYGVRVASKIIHIVVLATTVAMVEGPVVLGIAKDMTERNRNAQAEAHMRTLTAVPNTPNKEPEQKPWPPEPIYTERVAQLSGVEVGAPNLEPF